MLTGEGDQQGEVLIGSPPHTYKVRVNDVFWAPRIETNRTTTIPHDFEMCEKTGRIANFEVAGGLKKGEFKGIHYDDSDVYKVIEGASYSLTTHPDPELDHQRVPELGHEDQRQQHHMQQVEPNQGLFADRVRPEQDLALEAADVQG